MSERCRPSGILAELGADSKHNSRSRQDLPSGIFAEEESRSKRRLAVEDIFIAGANVAAGAAYIGYFAFLMRDELRTDFRKWRVHREQVKNLKKSF